MSSRDHRREPEDAEVSFEGIVDLGSIPPPASGPVDVHRAATAVATMTDELMDEIRRAKEEAKLGESQKTRIQPKFQVPEDAIPGFTDETPTRPGKDKEGKNALRPEAPDLHEPLPRDPGLTASVTQALPTPPVSFAETIPIIEAPPIVARRRTRLWPRLLFFVVTVAALIVSALAFRRYRARLRR